MSILKKGGNIDIKPENKGKFTATKKKTGKSTAELTHSKNPITKKRAIFAQNARKWKHKDGGLLIKPKCKKCGKVILKTNAPKGLCPECNGQ